MSDMCVLCKEADLEEIRESDLKINLRLMNRTPIAVKPDGSEIMGWYYNNPSVTFVNKWATQILGQQVLGNCVLIRKPGGLTAEAVRAAQPRTWSSIAKKLPSHVPHIPREEVKVPAADAPRRLAPAEDRAAPCGDLMCNGTCEDCQYMIGPTGDDSFTDYFTDTDIYTE